MKKLHPRPFMLFLPLCLRLTAADAPDFSNLSLQELAVTKVTSVSGNQQNLSQVAAAVYVMSQEEIHRSGMTTVADLLRLVPGLTVARLNGDTWAVSSRGFNARFANKLLVLVDGRSVYTPIFSGVYWDMSMPLLDDMERIEVIRGPGASIWGANAVSGVVNIITRSAEDTIGRTVTAGGGTTERAFGQVRFSGKAADGIFYRGYVGSDDRAASPAPPGQEAHDAWSNVQGGFRIDGATTNGGWQLEGDLYRNWRQEVGNVPSPQAGYAEAPVNGNFMGTSSSLAFDWRRRIGDNSELRVTASYDSTNRPETGLSLAESRTGDFEIKYRSTPVKHHEVSVGLGDRPISVDTTGSSLILFNPSQLTYQVASGFAQDEIHLLGDRLLLTFGAKLQHDLFGGWQLQPTARALWAPNKRHSVWVSVSQAARTPTLYERYGAVEVNSGAPSPETLGLPFIATAVGSPQYQAEIVRAYELGYRAQTSPRFSIDVAGFYDDYLHLRTEDLGASIFVDGSLPYLALPYPFSNRLRAQAFGGEIAMNYHPAPRWKLAGSYSYLNLHSHFLDDTPPGTNNPSQSASPANQWKIQSLLNLSQTVQFDSFLFTSSSVGSLAYPYVDVLPPHMRVDVRLGWRVTPRFEVSISGQDLLSPRLIEQVPEVLGPAGYTGRGYYLKTTWHF